MKTDMSKEKTSRMAIISLGLTVIFGVVPGVYCLSFPDAARGCVFAIFICAISFILALIGLISAMIKDKARMLSVGSLIFNIIVVAFLCGIVSDNEGRPTEKARRITCAGNIKQIGLALKLYAMDYSDSFPPANGAAGLEYLRKYNYLTDDAIYTCPSTITEMENGKQPLAEQIVDYVYVGGLNIKSDPNAPILYDKPGNHKDCGNVGTVNGKVKSIYGKDWIEKIKK